MKISFVVTILFIIAIILISTMILISVFNDSENDVEIVVSTSTIEPTIGEIVLYPITPTKQPKTARIIRYTKRPIRRRTPRPKPIQKPTQTPIPTPMLTSYRTPEIIINTPPIGLETIAPTIGIIQTPIVVETAPVDFNTIAPYYFNTD